MAHIGQQYPVAFRRDFNLNVTTNKFGWSRRYLGQIATLTQGFGGGLNGVIFDIGPDFYTDPREIDWQSDFQRIGLFFYRMELLVQIVNHTEFLRQFSFNVSGHGVILVAHYAGQIPSTPTPGFGYSPGFLVDFWDPGFWDTMPEGSATIVPKYWTDGPPH